MTDASTQYRASNYVAKLTLSALTELFSGARDIMGWLSECAKVISGSKGQPVSWVTPLGLPVVQPYRRTGKSSVKTILQSVTLGTDRDQPVAAARQASAFAPNFVHSLDASHMLTTAISCQRKGLTFAAVHDSFWTHSADVDTMNTLIRDEFVALYRQPILPRLHEHFILKHPDLQFPAVPQAGALDLDEVGSSPYFFD